MGSNDTSRHKGKSKAFLNHLTKDPPKSTDEKYEQWEQDDLVIFSWLIQNIEPAIASNLTEFPTAKILWDALTVTYSSGKDKLQTFDLHVKANGLKQNGAPLEEFWIVMQGIWGEIERRDPNPMRCPTDIAAYNKIRSENKLFQFLNALDQKYDPIKRDIPRWDPLPTAEAAYAVVQKETTHQNILEEQCFEIVGYPDWWVGNKKGKSGKAAAVVGSQETINIGSGSNTHQKAIGVEKYLSNPSSQNSTLFFENPQEELETPSTSMEVNMATNGGKEYNDALSWLKWMSSSEETSHTSLPQSTDPGNSTTNDDLSILMSKTHIKSPESSNNETKPHPSNNETEQHSSQVDQIKEEPVRYESLQELTGVYLQKDTLLKKKLEDPDIRWFTLSMRKYGFKQSNSDHTIFLKRKGKLVTCLIIYVDDMIITGNDEEEMTRLRTNLFKEFEMKDPGRLKYFLGIEVLRSKQGIFICQKKYVFDLLVETGMIDCKPVDTPMMVNQKLYMEEKSKLADKETYLKGTPGHGVLFKANGHLETQVYTDADWAGYKGNRRSTSGYFTLVDGNLVTWRSKKQKVVALSSAEAEFRGVARGLAETLWIRKLLSEIGYHSTQTSKIMCDNKAAIQISKNPVQHDRTKHIEVDRHFIKEKLENGDH
nr:putative Gag-polypeptide of LTR copia-type [Tanacetum cinerariifolium]